MLDRIADHGFVTAGASRIRVLFWKDRAAVVASAWASNPGFSTIIEAPLAVVQ